MLGFTWKSFAECYRVKQNVKTHIRSKYLLVRHQKVNKRNITLTRRVFLWEQLLEFFVRSKQMPPLD